jgi:hypothetical protein
MKIDVHTRVVEKARDTVIFTGRRASHPLFRARVGLV